MKKKSNFKIKLLTSFLALFSCAAINQLNNSHAMTSMLGANSITVDQATAEATENAKHFANNLTEESYNNPIWIPEPGGAYGLGDPIKPYIIISPYLTNGYKWLKLNDSSVIICNLTTKFLLSLLVDPTNPYGIDEGTITKEQSAKAVKKWLTSQSDLILPILSIPPDNSTIEEKTSEFIDHLQSNGLLFTVKNVIKPVTKEDFDAETVSNFIEKEKNNLYTTKFNELKQKEKTKLKDKLKKQSFSEEEINKRVNAEINDEYIKKLITQIATNNVNQKISEEINSKMCYKFWPGANANKAANDKFIETLNKELSKKNLKRNSNRNLYTSIQTNSADMNNDEGVRLMYNDGDERAHNFCTNLFKLVQKNLNKDEREIAEKRLSIQKYDKRQYRRVPTTSLDLHPVLHSTDFSNNPEMQQKMMDINWNELHAIANVMAANKLNNVALNFADIVLEVNIDEKGNLVLFVTSNVEGDFLETLDGITVVITNAYTKKDKENELKTKLKLEKKGINNEWKGDTNLNNINKNIDWKNEQNNKFYFDTYGVYKNSDEESQTTNKKIFSNVKSFEITNDYKKQIIGGELQIEKPEMPKPAVRINEVDLLKIKSEFDLRNKKNNNK